MKKALAALLLCSILLLLLAAPAPAEAGDVFPWGNFKDWWPSPKDFRLPTSVQCNVKGRCYKKMLRCPEKCTKTVKSSGKTKNTGPKATTFSCFLDCNKCEARC